MSAAVAFGIARRMFELTEFTVPYLRTKSRTAPLARARQAIMCVLRERTEWSYPQIAKFMGCSDHTTAIHARKVSLKRAESDASFAWFLDQLREAEPCTLGALERAYSPDMAKVKAALDMVVVLEMPKPKPEPLRGFDQDGMNDDGETPEMFKAKIGQLAGNDAFLAALNAARAA